MPQSPTNYEYLARSKEAGSGRRQRPVTHPIVIIHRTCCIAGSTSLIDEIRDENVGLSRAINDHDTPTLFDWLIDTLSYQGISDQVASGYIARHGQATWRKIERGLPTSPRCPKLRNYWHFYDCRFDKSSRTCARPDHIGRCPLPRHQLRNGRLNRTAYALHLFLRDIADGDFVGWIDGQLDAADLGVGIDRLSRMRTSLIDPMREIYGVSDKILNMTLSMLMLGSDDPRWIEVGGTLIAVDRLVHNFLHRTGILSRWGASHGYGAKCYAPGGCVDLIRRAADLIDARQFNPTYPAGFPRFVQHAIWRFCAQQQLNTCNGNRIDDNRRCENVDCTIRGICDRIRLT